MLAKRRAQFLLLIVFTKNFELNWWNKVNEKTVFSFVSLQLAEKGKSFVDIQGLTAATMEILLDFVYTETVLVTVENVQELLPAACLLQLKGKFRSACRASLDFKEKVTANR